LLIYPDSHEARERAARFTTRGGLIAFRTDTFYGVGADPFNPSALELINTLKGRDGKPILVLAADAEDAERLFAERTRTFDLLAARHWPGALTLVAAARAEVPELLTAGTGTVGVRLPDDAEARAIVRACGGLLTATSANPAGRPPARTAAEVADYFPNGLGLIINSGATHTELPSTVIDVTATSPRLIREGVVTRAELEETLRAAGITFQDLKSQI
jgi:L-threonylcarbamoyladenylate synthase